MTRTESAQGQRGQIAVLNWERHTVDSRNIRGNVKSITLDPCTGE